MKEWPFDDLDALSPAVQFLPEAQANEEEEEEELQLAETDNVSDTPVEYEDPDAAEPAEEGRCVVAV